MHEFADITQFDKRIACKLWISNTICKLLMKNKDFMNRYIFKYVEMLIWKIISILFYYIIFYSRFL